MEGGNWNERILKTICQMVSLTELKTMRLVCRTWNHAAMNTIVENYGYEISDETTTSKRKLIQMTIEIIKLERANIDLPMLRFEDVLIACSPSDLNVRKFLQLRGSDIKEVKLDLILKYKEDYEGVASLIELVPNVQVLTLLSSSVTKSEHAVTRGRALGEAGTLVMPKLASLSKLVIQVCNDRMELSLAQKYAIFMIKASLQMYGELSPLCQLSIVQTLTNGQLKECSKTDFILVQSGYTKDALTEIYTKIYMTSLKHWKNQVVPFLCDPCLSKQIDHVMVSLLDVILMYKSSVNVCELTNVTKITLLPMDRNNEAELEAIKEKEKIRDEILLLKMLFPHANTFHLIVQRKRTIHRIFELYPEVSSLHLTLRTNVIAFDSINYKTISTIGTTASGFNDVRKVNITGTLLPSVAALSCKTKINLARYSEYEKKIDVLTVEASPPFLYSLLELKNLTIDYCITKPETEIRELDEDDLSDELRPAPTNLFVHAVLLKMKGLETLILCNWNMPAALKKRYVKKLGLKKVMFFKALQDPENRKSCCR